MIGTWQGWLLSGLRCSFIGFAGLILDEGLGNGVLGTAA